jgi:hypothetical protein
VLLSRFQSTEWLRQRKVEFTAVARAGNYGVTASTDSPFAGCYYVLVEGALSSRGALFCCASA